ncbi:MAG: hypothetical protein WCJ14_10110 [Verrucomicrobiota bacterium]
MALAFASCAYDPYYSSGGGYYGASYGDGYGYGGSNFTTSFFVATGDPRWGYDPYCYSYYDYQRRCYYDPYLNGYYPMGFRPAVVFGVPHPYGWRPGRGYISPPHNVNYGIAVNYRDRESAYRNSNYGWSHQVRTQPAASGYAARNNSYPQSNQSAYSGNYARTQPAASGYAARNNSYPQSNQSAYSGNYARTYGQGRSPGPSGNYARTNEPSRPDGRGGNYGRTYEQGRAAASASPSSSNYVPSRQAAGNSQPQNEPRHGYPQGRTPGTRESSSSQPAAGYSRPAADSPQRQFQQQSRQPQPQPARQPQPQPQPSRGDGDPKHRRDAGAAQ